MSNKLDNISNLMLLLSSGETSLVSNTHKWSFYTLVVNRSGDNEIHCDGCKKEQLLAFGFKNKGCIIFICPNCLREVTSSENYKDDGHMFSYDGDFFERKNINPLINQFLTRETVKCIRETLNDSNFKEDIIGRIKFGKQITMKQAVHLEPVYLTYRKNPFLEKAIRSSIRINMRDIYRINQYNEIDPKKKYVIKLFLNKEQIDRLENYKERGKKDE